MLKIVPAVAGQIPGKAVDMIPEALSNCLWAAAHLEEAAPEVLKIVAALAAQIPFKAGRMKPQHLSSSLWALKDFADASPAVVKAVQALVQQIPRQVEHMKSQELGNTVEALVFLGKSFPIDQQQGVIAASAAQLKRFLPRLNGKELMLNVPMVVWACRRSNVEDERLFAAVVDLFSAHELVASLPPWGLRALNLGSELVFFFSIFPAETVRILNSGILCCLFCKRLSNLVSSGSGPTKLLARRRSSTASCISWRASSIDAVDTASPSPRVRSWRSESLTSAGHRARSKGGRVWRGSGL